MKRLKSLGRFIGVIAIGATAYVFAKFQGGFVSWFIFYMLLPFVVYSILLYLYPLRDLTVERRMESRQFTNNGKVTIRVKLKRSWPFPLPYVVLMDKRIHAERVQTVREIVLMGFRRTYEYSYVLKNVQRGEYILPAVEIEVVDFFNWIRKKKTFFVRDSFLVYPNISNIEYAVTSNGTGEGQRLSAFMLAKDATTPSSVREYAPGDRMSLIHWKSFARTSKLMTKEFDEHRSEHYTVLLDCSNSESFEDAVEFAASFIASAAQQQAKLTFITAAAEPKVFPVMQTSGQTGQAIVYLAKIQPQQAERISIPLEKTTIGDSLLVITADLRFPFIRDILNYYRDPSAIVCFVMVTDEINEKEVEDVVHQVELLGVTVKLISPSTRSSVLKKAVPS